MNEWIIYFLVLNIVAFLIMGYDKRQAKQKGRRVAERTLFFLAFVGGSLGIYVGMKQFRHKTKHRNFVIGLPLIIITQIIIIAYIIIYT